MGYSAGQVAKPTPQLIRGSQTLHRQRSLSSHVASHKHATQTPCSRSQTPCEQSSFEPHEEAPASAVPPNPPVVPTLAPPAPPAPATLISASGNSTEGVVSFTLSQAPTPASSATPARNPCRPIPSNIYHQCVTTSPICSATIRFDHQERASSCVKTRGIPVAPFDAKAARELPRLPDFDGEMLVRFG
jgi:hypothetical protein